MLLWSKFFQISCYIVLYLFFEILKLHYFCFQVAMLPKKQPFGSQNRENGAMDKFVINKINSSLDSSIEDLVNESK